MAHFYRKEYDESVVSYERALGLDAGNAEYARGLEQARKIGGSAEALRRRKEAQRRLGTAAKARTPPHDSRVERDRRDLERYERELAGYHKQRRECAERWRASCGIAGGKDWPQEDRGRSVHVDIFGNLRGKVSFEAHTHTQTKWPLSPNGREVGLTRRSSAKLRLRPRRWWIISAPSPGATVGTGTWTPWRTRGETWRLLGAPSAAGRTLSTRTAASTL